MKRSHSKKGFTLVEIMIVVVIIGLLAAMAIPAFQRVRQNSRRSSVENLVRQIAGAADQYMLENGVTAVNYAALTGNEAYLKGDVVSQLNAKGLNVSLNNNALTTTFTIGQGEGYSFGYAGTTSNAITGVW